MCENPRTVVWKLNGQVTMMMACVQVVDKSSEEAQIIQQYVKNTHAATHNTYTLEVEEVRGAGQCSVYFYSHRSLYLNTEILKCSTVELKSLHTSGSL